MEQNEENKDLLSDTKIEYESRYQQIAVEMAEKIAEGWYQVGEKITARSTIATSFGVSPETARKALQILVDMGIVSIRQGSGAYIKSREKAQMFFERFSETVSIVQTKRAITEAIQKQRSDLDHLNELLDDLVALTKRDHNTMYIIPHDMRLDENCNFIGKTIGELNIWQQTGATIVAVRRGRKTVFSPGPYEQLQAGDVILFVGNDSTRQRMLNLFNAKPENTDSEDE